MQNVDSSEGKDDNIIMVYACLHDIIKEMEERV